MSNLPKQVQKTIQEVEEYEKALLQEQQSPDSESVPEPEQELEPDQEAKTEQAPESQPEQDQEPQQQADPSEKWEEKYKVLQGKYNAEVPRLHQELKELRNAFGQLQQQVEQKPESKSEPEQKPQTSFVTDEDRDNFGEDLIEVQRRVAREVVAELHGELNTLRQENKALKEQFGQVHTDNFQTRLTQAIPDFQQIDQDPRWIGWLDEVDPLLRGPRRTIAEHAWQRGDVEAIRSYVDLWKQSLGEPNKPARQDRTSELKKQVQPTRASAPPSPQAQQGKVYTDAEARRAFDRIQKLISAGNYDEASALEQEISAAYVEGRIRQ